ncbi:MAG: molybdopterin-dependent oxidoreductase [Chloroflexi bacterium]|nr:molybdopterin-dependent oxidoreductase [Chloroflexota bacterium]
MIDDEKLAINRRTFLKIAGATAAGYAVMRGLPAVEAATQVVNEAAETPLLPGEPRWLSTVCLQCDAGCGLRVKVVDGKAVKVDGNKLFPTNHGGTCPKGQAALQVLYDPDRIRTPLRRTGERGEGKWESITWPQALEIAAQRLKAIRDQGQPHTLAFMGARYRGHMHNLVKQFLNAYGSPNDIVLSGAGADTALKAYYLSQGSEDPLAFDLVNANYVIFFGAAWAEAWRPTVEVARLYGVLRQGRPGIRTKIVQVDTRLSMSAAKSDQQVYVKPGTDGALALGLAHVIVRDGLYDEDFVSKQGFGFEDWEDGSGRKHTGFKTVVLRDCSPASVARITGVSEADIVRLAREFARYQPSLALGGRGCGGHTNGLYNQWAVHCLNALMGNFNKPGGIQERRLPPFAAWPEARKDAVAAAGLGQPRLDGAGGAGFPLATSVGRAFTESLKSGSPYKVNALFLYYVNPAYSQLEAQAFADALKNVPFIVSFSPFRDDTTLHADLVLPDSTFLERWDDDIISPTPGYPMFGLRQPVVEPLYDTANTGDVIITLSHMMGGSVSESFPWKSYRRAVQEAVTGVAGKGQGSPQGNNFDDYWNKLVEQGGWWDEGTAASVAFKFSTPSGKFEFYSQTMKGKLESLAQKEAGARGTAPDRALDSMLSGMKIKARGDEIYLPHYEEPRISGDEKDYPFYLNTYKPMMLAQGRGANTPFLLESYGAHVPGRWTSWVEMNPETAHELGIKEGAQAWVESPLGKFKVRVKLYPGAMPEVINMPVGFGHKGWGRWAKDSGVNPNTVMVSDMDYLVGTPAWGATRVKIYKATD